MCVCVCVVCVCVWCVCVVCVCVHLCVRVCVRSRVVCICTDYNVLSICRVVSIHVLNPNIDNHAYSWITSRPFFQGDVHGSIAGNVLEVHSNP